MTSTVDDAEQAARAAYDSRPLEVLARLGLAARGLVWLVLGLLAFSLARGVAADADQDGAFRALAHTPVGGPLLATLALGFLGYATWLLLSAAVGHRAETGATRLRHRAEGLVKGIFYLALCAGTVRFLLRGSGTGDVRSRTAQVLAHPGGRTAVALVGLVVVGVGLYMIAKAVTRRHADCLEHYRVPPRLRRPAVFVGAVGYLGRGLVVALVGAFLLRAAVLADARQAKGLDAALETVAQQPYGQVLLASAATGLLAFALWSFFEAAYRDL
ncbi:MAG: DUF1206 domain-containing protein [Mycobacteriales bacterium]